MSACDIVLATVNATWSHPAMALRCLRANLGPLRERSRILEFDPRGASAARAEAVLRCRPRIVGLSVYIWNVAAMAALAAEIKTRAPDTVVIAGGPEVSHEWEDHPAAARADYIVRNEGESLFAELCSDLLAGQRPSERVLDGGRADLSRILPPYMEYSEEDLRTRFVY